MRVYVVHEFHEDEDSENLYTANKRRARRRARELYKGSVPCSVYVFDFALRPVKRQMLAALNGRTGEYNGTQLYDYNPYSDDAVESGPPRF